MIGKIGMKVSFPVKIETAAKTNAEMSASAGDAAVSGEKNTGSLPDSVVETIRQAAREGAKKEVYMGDEYIAYINSYKRQHVSPDRPALIRMMTPMLAHARDTNGRPSSFHLTGLPFTGIMCVGATGTSLFLYDGNGDEVLSYSSGTGWTEGHTKAEDQFYDETTAVYHEAYAAARAELNAGAQSAPAFSSGFDVTA